MAVYNLNLCSQHWSGVHRSRRAGGQPSHCMICMSEVTVTWSRDPAPVAQLAGEERGMSLPPDPGGLSLFSLSQDSSLNVQFWSGPGQREGRGKEIYSKFTVYGTYPCWLGSLTCKKVMVSDLRRSSLQWRLRGRGQARGRPIHSLQGGFVQEKRTRNLHRSQTCFGQWVGHHHSRR